MKFEDILIKDKAPLDALILLFEHMKLHRDLNFLEDTAVCISQSVGALLRERPYMERVHPAIPWEILGDFGDAIMNVTHDPIYDNRAEVMKLGVRKLDKELENLVSAFKHIRDYPDYEQTDPVCPQLKTLIEFAIQGRYLHQLRQEVDAYYAIDQLTDEQSERQIHLLFLTARISQSVAHLSERSQGFFDDDFLKITRKARHIIAHPENAGNWTQLSQIIEGNNDNLPLSEFDDTNNKRLSYVLEQKATFEQAVVLAHVDYDSLCYRKEAFQDEGIPLSALHYSPEKSLEILTRALPETVAPIVKSKKERLDAIKKRFASRDVCQKPLNGLEEKIIEALHQAYPKETQKIYDKIALSRCVKGDMASFEATKKLLMAQKRLLGPSQEKDMLESLRTIHIKTSLESVDEVRNWAVQMRSLVLHHYKKKQKSQTKLEGYLPRYSQILADKSDVLIEEYNKQEGKSKTREELQAEYDNLSQHVLPALRAYTDGTLLELINKKQQQLVTLCEKKEATGHIAKLMSALNVAVQYSPLKTAEDVVDTTYAKEDYYRNFYLTVAGSTIRALLEDKVTGKKNTSFIEDAKKGNIYDALKGIQHFRGYLMHNQKQDVTAESPVQMHRFVLQGHKWMEDSLQGLAVIHASYQLQLQRQPVSVSPICIGAELAYESFFTELIGSLKVLPHTENVKQVEEKKSQAVMSVSKSSNSGEVPSSSKVVALSEKPKKKAPKRIPLRPLTPEPSSRIRSQRPAFRQIVPSVGFRTTYQSKTLPFDGHR